MRRDGGPGRTGSAGDGDGWVRCDLGHRHWGRYGAAGLLLRDGAGTHRVVLQHRAWWSHQGGTWGVPGGARDSAETAVQAALRETSEEAGLDPASVRPTGLLVDDHGGWSYSTVVGEPLGAVQPRPTGGESEDVRWVTAADLATLPLHPGFAATWPRLRAAPPGLTVVVDAANVVGARGAGDGWWRDRAAATGRLLEALAPLADGLSAAELPAEVPAGGMHLLLPRLVAVVEGAARSATGPAAVEVVPAPGSGDDMIVQVAEGAAADGTVVVVTADRGLRNRLDRVGARWVGPSWLLRLADSR
ncbi:MAG TPA: NUDIX hydrolase [Mycobacteriales bacterium]|nr:NUDIX hydrolase [Mycobacteriales bacterium]